MNINQVSFTEKELHCIARWLQNEFYPVNEDEASLISGCWYCKYREGCIENTNHKLIHLHSAREKLELATGVNITNCLSDTKEHVYLPASFQLAYPQKYREIMLKFKIDDALAFKNRLDVLEKYRPIEYGYVIGLLALNG